MGMGAIGGDGGNRWGWGQWDGGDGTAMPSLGGRIGVGAGPPGAAP